jgi:hypothetical protein
MVMERDFTKIVAQARTWLGRTEKRSVVKSQYFLRGIQRCVDATLLDPYEHVRAIEIRGLPRISRYVGSLIVSGTDDGRNDAGILQWDDTGEIMVMSPLTFQNDMFVPLSSIYSGFVLDTIHNRFAPAVACALDQMQ